MRKLIVDQNSVLLKEEESSCSISVGQVKIKIKMVGLCRTDLLVAEKSIKVNYPRVLGHESSGIIVDSMSTKFNIGDKVAINPLINDMFLGLDLDGTLQDYIILDEGFVYKVNNLDYQSSAYLEPVAAAMAVLKIDMNKFSSIAIFGNNRIAELITIILSSYNIKFDWIKELSDFTQKYDLIIETDLNQEIFLKLINYINPHGTLLIKTRKTREINININDLIKQEISISFVNYYEFEEALNWLEQNHNYVSSLFGSVFELSDWMIAFEEAKNNESKKIFISLEESLK